jgi:hypothetical protein
VDATDSRASAVITGPSSGLGTSTSARSQTVPLAAASQAASGGTSTTDDGSSVDEVTTLNPGEAVTADAPNAAIILSNAAVARGGSDAAGLAGGSSNASNPESPSPAGVLALTSGRSVLDTGLAKETTTKESTVSPAESETVPVTGAGRRAVPDPARHLPDLRGRSEAGGRVVEAGGVEEPVPSPRGSDLLTTFLPFDRASLESAVDRFLTEFERLGAELAGGASVPRLVPALAVVTISALALEVVRRRRSGDAPARPCTTDDDEDLLGFAAGPTCWSLGEA